MASGKTAVGGALAVVLGRPFLDNDTLLGASADVVARVEGIDVLHEREEAVALAALQRPEPSVIAVAASVVESPLVRSALTKQFVVRLTADPATLAHRFANGAHRPHLDQDPAPRRVGWYEAVADLTIDTTTTPVDEATTQIVAALPTEGR